MHVSKYKMINLFNDAVEAIWLVPKHPQDIVDTVEFHFKVPLVSFKLAWENSRHAVAHPVMGRLIYHIVLTHRPLTIVLRCAANIDLAQVMLTLGLAQRALCWTEPCPQQLVPTPLSAAELPTRTPVFLVEKSNVSRVIDSYYSIMELAVLAGVMDLAALVKHFAFAWCAEPPIEGQFADSTFLHVRMVHPPLQNEVQYVYALSLLFRYANRPFMFAGQKYLDGLCKLRLLWLENRGTGERWDVRICLGLDPSISPSELHALREHLKAILLSNWFDSSLERDAHPSSVLVKFPKEELQTAELAELSSRVEGRFCEQPFGWSRDRIQMYNSKAVTKGEEYVVSFSFECRRRDQILLMIACLVIDIHPRESLTIFRSSASHLP